MLNRLIKTFICLVLFSFSLTGCGDGVPDFPAGVVKGYRPIYQTQVDTVVAFSEARQVSKPGKIYSYGKYLMVNEQGEGIHVFDNENPADPKPLGFMKLHGNVDIAIKNNVMYADRLGSVVALDISDIHTVKIISFIKTPIVNLPPVSDHYYECIDSDKGEVVGWELVDLYNPRCYR